MIIVSIKDTVANAFFEPRVAANAMAAIREFKLVAGEPSDSLLYKRAEDFQMWQLGTWDPETGKIEYLPVQLAQGVKNVRNES
ncbi:nonstructural protein [Capybara microvirus Cap3_SP_391]|nr:nonstructural protein [Capybara microvirus Cap3_SP_391]